ncbi:hypothetical protein [Spirochaeta cellobiosiphila]|uniref:hypothetical protein n=1 Tax=Spirochaeta cellobiosiphila TaxID=504483 RepID=UPI0003FC0F04|nr:hypothetical protein [Spirochaeta cellobiosiphila]
MASKIMMCFAILLINLFPVYASDAFYRVTTGDDEYVEWSEPYDYDSNDRFLRISLYRNSQKVWSTDFMDLKADLEAVSLPLTAYIVTDQIITFPVTFLMDKEGDLARQQISIKKSDGSLLWSMDLPVGIGQEYYYSNYDGKHLYIHNQHPFERDLFPVTCIDMESGNKLWDSIGPYEAALPLDTEDYFILHNSKLQRFYVYDKSDGAYWTQRCNSPVFIYEDKMIWLELEGGTLNICRASEPGKKEVLFTVTSTSKEQIIRYNPGTTHISMTRIPYGDSLLVPCLMYKDKLIIPFRNSQGQESLKAFNLKGQVQWSLALPTGYKLDYHSFYGKDTILGPYNIPRDFLKAYPKHAPQYQSHNPIQPFLITVGYPYYSDVMLTDLDKGSILWFQRGGDESPYVVGVLKDLDRNYYFLEQTNQEDDEYNYVLRGSEGFLTEYVRYVADTFDMDDIGVSPYHRVIQSHTELMNWKALDEDIIQSLIAEAGLPLKAFTVNNGTAE